ncbi:MAG: 3-dehydroquinate synthase II [Candidatus Bathyarchaeota archaeon]|nr:3-dehydroquinate synthase II [Candidatus Bathyarchaeota archaeon]
MKQFWVKIDETSSPVFKKKMFEATANVCGTLLVDTSDLDRARETGLQVAATSDDSDIFFLESIDERKMSDLKKKRKPVVVTVKIAKRSDEKIVRKTLELSPEYIILDCSDWKIIPLENIIAQNQKRSKLIAKARSAEDAKIALTALELGVDGIILETSDLNEAVNTAAIFRQEIPRVTLTPAEVILLKPIEIGARVCIDTCDLMSLGEGILSGCQSNGLFLIEAEVHRNEFIETRPFRVNAGPVSNYTLTSGGKTRYLSELQAGEKILIVDREGNARSANVGRVKIEWRPMILIEALCNGRVIKAIVQNAETLRFISEGDSKPVTELKQGDLVLAYIQDGGRHSGVLVEEERVIER